MRSNSGVLLKSLIPLSPADDQRLLFSRGRARRDEGKGGKGGKREKLGPFPRGAPGITFLRFAYPGVGALGFSQSPQGWWDSPDMGMDRDCGVPLLWDCGVPQVQGLWDSPNPGIVGFLSYGIVGFLSSGTVGFLKSRDCGIP